jgi:hypothetical protein
MKNKLTEISKGIINYIVTDDSVEVIAKERKAICDSCPNKVIQLGLECCGLCHCILEFKTRSLDSVCPDGKWG